MPALQCSLQMPLMTYWALYALGRGTMPANLPPEVCEPLGHLKAAKRPRCHQMISRLSKDRPFRQSAGFTPGVPSAVRGVSEPGQELLSRLLQLTVKPNPTQKEDPHDGALNCEDV